MEASISLALRNLHKSVTCSICIDFFSNPITVLCGHSFCKACIDQALLQKSVCPICSAKIRKRTIESNDALQPLITSIANFVEACQFVEGDSSINGAPPARSIVKETTQKLALVMSSDEDNNHEHVSNTMSASSATSTVRAANIPTPMHLIGSLVNITPRLWIGINKPGGTARILSVVNDDSTPTQFAYTVKYVLDGRVETSISEFFIEPYSELNRASRKSKLVNSPLGDLDQPGPGATVETVESSSATKRRKICAGEKSKPVPLHTDSGDLYWSSSASSSTMSVTKKSASKILSSPSAAHNVRNTRTAPIVMLSTSLDPELQSKLHQLADLCPGVAVSNSFSGAVTHLVVSTDRDRTMRQRTMKYMQALISGIWIVSVEWVLDALDKRCIQAEESYEVRKNAKASEHFAPRRARLATAYLVQHPPPAQANGESASSSSKQQSATMTTTSSAATSSLFADCVVLLHGQFPTPGPPRSDIHYLLVRGGATVCATVKDFVRFVAAAEHSAKRKVVVCSAKIYEQDFLSMSPATTNAAGKGSSMAEFCANKKIVALSHAWVLDSVVNYKLLPLDYPLV